MCQLNIYKVFPIHCLVYWILYTCNCVKSTCSIFTKDWHQIQKTLDISNTDISNTDISDTDISKNLVMSMNVLLKLFIFFFTFKTAVILNNWVRLFKASLA